MTTECLLLHWGRWVVEGVVLKMVELKLVLRVVKVMVVLLCKVKHESDPERVRHGRLGKTSRYVEGRSMCLVER